MGVIGKTGPFSHLIEQQRLGSTTSCSVRDYRVTIRIETRTVDVLPSLRQRISEPQASGTRRGQCEVALFMIKLAEPGEDLAEGG